MAGPWEKFQQPAAAPQSQMQADGPWSKFAAPVATPAADDGWGPVPALLPAQRNSKTGEWRPTMPQVLRDIVGGVEAPQKALTGGYGMEIDPATGRPTTITNEMIGDAVSGAGIGVGALELPNAAAAAATRAGRPVLTGAARRTILRGLSADDIPLSEVPARMSEMGPDAMLGDLGPTLQGKTAAVATMPGRGAKTVVDALTTRKAGTNQRIISDVNDTLGQSPVPSEMQAVIQGNKDALSPAYTDLFANNASRVDTSPIALDLDSMAVNLRGKAQEAATKVRRMLDVSGTDQLDPNPETLFQTRQAIDGMLGTETDSKAIGILKNVRAKVDRMLAEAVPGIKDVDAQFGELARQGNAIDRGQQMLDSGRTAPRPSEVAAEMNGAPASTVEVGPSNAQPIGGPIPQGSLVGPSAVPLRLSQGARAEIDRIIGTTSNDLNALRTALKGDGSWNRERLTELFGENRTKRLLQIFDRELKYDQTQNLALEGARTQRLKAAQEDIVGAGPKANPIRSAANWRFGDAAAETADRALGWIGDTQRAATNAAIGDALTSGAGSELVAGLPNFQPGIAQQRAPLAALRAYLETRGDDTNLPMVRR